MFKVFRFLALTVAGVQASKDTGRRGEYQLQDTTMTLGEGLLEYYKVNRGLSDPSEMKDPASAQYFKSHDTTHVFFGTHTGDLNEGFNDLSTMFGVDVSYTDYVSGFAESEVAGDISLKFVSRAADTIKLTYDTFQFLPKIYKNCNAMSKQWPWVPPPEYYDRSLAELRREYNFNVIIPEEALEEWKQDTSFEALLTSIAAAVLTCALFGLIFFILTGFGFFCCCCRPCRSKSTADHKKKTN